MNQKKLLKKLKSFQKSQIKEDYKDLSFTIVLVQPEHSGNIGFIARLMKNFNFHKLVIFDPMESDEMILSSETQGHAMHGVDILFEATIQRVKNKELYFQEYKNYMKQYDLIIASTAKGKHSSNLRRLAIFPEDFSLPISKKPLNIALLFGKESSGLTNEEISIADILIRIPTGDDYPTLNLSHACGIILYEIFKKITNIRLGRGENPSLIADKKDRLLLYKFIKNIIDTLKIQSHRENNFYYAFKNVFERALMTKKELSLITGLFSKIESILKDLKLYDH